MENQPMIEATPMEFAKTVIKHALFYTLAVAAVLLFCGKPSWARGLGLGGLASGINFLAMSLLLPRAVLTGGRSGQGWGALSLGLRLVLMGVAFGVALAMPQRFAPAACAVGLFAVQLTIFIDRFIEGLKANTAGSN